MRKLMKYAAAVAVAAMMSGPAFAQIDFTDDFESYDLYVGPGDQGLIGGGWKVFANVFGNYPTCDPYWYGYGTFDAPNKDSGFSNIVIGSTGQALNVFSDYNNADHENNACIEASVFQEVGFTAADAGTYDFQFLTEVPGPLGDGVTTYGFVKLLDPNNFYATVLFEKASTVGSGAKSITVTLDAVAHDGMILQWGFGSIASNYEASGRFYDDVSFALEGVYDPPTGSFVGFEGVPIPQWALLIMIGLLGYVGLTRIRSRQQN